MDLRPTRELARLICGTDFEDGCTIEFRRGGVTTRLKVVTPQGQPHQWLMMSPRNGDANHTIQGFVWGFDIRGEPLWRARQLLLRYVIDMSHAP